MMVKDMVGFRSGRLVVVDRGEPSPGSTQAMWNVICDCGKRTTAPGQRLRSRRKTSCGCLSSELWVAAARVHGHAGKVKSREFRAWKTMRQRCLDPRNIGYPAYGGRGITISERWVSSFQTFFEDVGPSPSEGHSLDRFPNSKGNYEPGNVRWATEKQQQRNRSSNHPVTAFGKTMLVVEWAETTGISPTTIGHRLRSGWPPERAVSKALRSKAPDGKLAAFLGRHPRQ